jgi:hypothetical protein
MIAHKQGKMISTIKKKRWKNKKGNKYFCTSTGMNGKNRMLFG